MRVLLLGIWGGNYTLQGTDVTIAALDIVGIVDPTGIADVAAATLEAQQGNYGSAILSGLGVVPLIGDLGKLGKIGKHVKTINNAIEAQQTGLKVGDKIASSSKAARREAMRDAGIPTSQPLLQDKATKSSDRVLMTRDGKNTVQNARNDRGHQGQPHWEAGPTKRNVNSPDGLNRSGQNNKPQMGKPKSKVYY